MSRLWLHPLHPRRRNRLLRWWFLLAGVLTACWLVMLAWLLLQPDTDSLSALTTPALAGLIALLLALALLLSLPSYLLRRFGGSLTLCLLLLVPFVVVPLWALIDLTLNLDWTLQWGWRYELLGHTWALPRYIIIVAVSLALPLLIILIFRTPLPLEKSNFRRDAIQARKAIPPEVRQRETQLVCERAFERLSTLDPQDGFIGIYAATGSELSLSLLALKLGEAGYAVAWPAIISDTEMEFYSTLGSDISKTEDIPKVGDIAQAGDIPTVATDAGEAAGIDESGFEVLELFVNPFKRLAPELLGQLRKIAPTELSAVIVPGTAFDRDGYRMGFGGGYYDRYLPLLRPGTRLYGVCFSAQLHDSLPVEAHDRRLDAVISPR